MLTDLEVIKTRIVEDLLSGLSAKDPAQRLKDAEHWAAMLTADGAWPDVQYDHLEQRKWLAIDHLKRIETIAIAYRQTGRPALKRAALQAYEHWIRNDYQKPDHYWWNAIGTPTVLGPLMLLLEAEFDADHLEAGLAILGRGYHDGMWDYCGNPATGQNLIWLAGAQVHKSLLENSDEHLKLHLSRLYEEIYIVEGDEEGIQVDHSFWQHHQLLYAGGYGLCFSFDCAYWAAMCRDTAFAMPDERLAILIDFVLEGPRWMCRGHCFDLSTMGREITRENRSGAVEILGKTFSYLACVNNPRQAACKSAARQLLAGATDAPDMPQGNRVYWRSDYMVHRRQAYFFSVKMSSTRIIGTESMNGENVQGLHLPDGAALLMCDGQEYLDAPPVWQWRQIPGITCRQQQEPIHIPRWDVRGTTSFVGGVSDGQYGLAFFDYDKFDLQARKAWFCFDDHIVCLGAGITCQHDGPVWTCVDQRLLRGRIDSSQGDPPIGQQQTIEGPAWIRHHGITYLFPEQQKLLLKAGPVTGNWNRIDTNRDSEEVTQDMLHIAVDHGQRPTNHAYCFIISPTSTHLPTTIADCDVSVLSNTPTIQAARCDRTQTTGIVCYEAGVLKLSPTEHIEVSAPCAVLMRRRGQQTEVSVASPAGELSQVRVALTANEPAGPRTHELQFNLPGKPFLGQSVRQVM